MNDDVIRARYERPPLPGSRSVVPSNERFAGFKIERAQVVGDGVLSEGIDPKVVCGMFLRIAGALRQSGFRGGIERKIQRFPIFAL